MWSARGAPLGLLGARLAESDVVKSRRTVAWAKAKGGQVGEEDWEAEEEEWEAAGWAAKRQSSGRQPPPGERVTIRMQD